MTEPVQASGALLARIKALLAEFGPVIIADLPTIEADIAAGNYLGALLSVLQAIAGQTPKMSAEAPMPARVQIIKNHVEAFNLFATKHPSRITTALAGLRLGQLLYDNNVNAGDGLAGVSVAKSATPDELAAAGVEAPNWAGILAFIEQIMTLISGIKPAA